MLTKSVQMLKKIRVILAAACFMAVTLLFLDFTGALHLWLGWMAKIQFLPAVLSLNLAVIIALILLTLIFGRIYCSVICPLGVFQDIFAHWGAKSRKKPYKFSKELKWLRYGVFILFVIAVIAGIHAIVALLAPYSAYGRIAQNLFQPVYILFNNILAWLAERAGSYAFYSREPWLRSLPTLLVATASVVILVILALKGGRTYCNTICPVGTALSFFSRFSLFKPVINVEKCKNCKLCERNCKASCIDISRHYIDYSRCVDCFNCIGACKFDALHYTIRKNSGKGKPKAFAKGKFEKAERDIKASATSVANKTGVENISRRAFLIGAGLITGSTVAHAAEEIKNDGGLAPIKPKQAPVRKTKITPPGSVSLKNMYDHCTACQLCVAACPNNVLRPSTGLDNFMQPESSYERGYCRPECTKCSEVCPAGAILKIDKAEKSSIQIGHAVWLRELCLPVKDGVSCGNCARHCPVGAIRMVALETGKSGLRVPAVNEERCIGCGACENLCPSRPLSAIYVEGHQVHRKI